MRVAYVDAETYPSATPASIQTVQTCMGLAQHAEEVWLVGGRGAAGDVTGYYGLDLPPNLRLVRVPRCRWNPGGVRLTWSLPFHLLALRALRQLVRKRQVSAVLVRNLKLAQFLLRAHRVSPLPPIVFESHQIYGDVAREEAGRAGRDLTRRQQRLTQRETEVYRQAAGLIVLTRQMAAALPARFQTHGSPQVIPDGVDLRQALPVAGSAASGPVTYLGSFHYWKGVEVPLHALVSAPGLTLRLVGGAPEPRARLAALAEALHVAERVQFTGPVTPAARWHYLAEASVCLLPLTRSVFGLAFSSPLKMFEYMAAARPIVASDVPVVREVLSDGENALLVPPDDPPAWAAAIQRLRTDPALSRRLARQAAADARRYTWDCRGRHIVDFLDTVTAAA
jgi:glycosyltransferase involved in cell wall biosynthesis